MRNTKVCPKCGSNDIVIVPGLYGELDGLEHFAPPGSILVLLAITRYFCCNCGFSEEWIESPEDREKIKKTFGERQDETAFPKMAGKIGHFLNGLFNSVKKA
jgi:ribosomal protein S27AE